MNVIDTVIEIEDLVRFIGNRMNVENEYDLWIKEKKNKIILKKNLINNVISQKYTHYSNYILV